MWEKLAEWIRSDEAKEMFDNDLRFESTFRTIIAKACEFADSDKVMIWSNGGELLVPTLEIANKIADALDEVLDVETSTGSYDDDVNDMCSRWHYITF